MPDGSKRLNDDLDRDLGRALNGAKVILIGEKAMSRLCEAARHPDPNVLVKEYDKLGWGCPKSLC